MCFTHSLRDPSAFLEAFRSSSPSHIWRFSALAGLSAQALRNQMAAAVSASLIAPCSRLSAAPAPPGVPWLPHRAAGNAVARGSTRRRQCRLPPPEHQFAAGLQPVVVASAAAGGEHPPSRAGSESPRHGEEPKQSWGIGHTLVRAAVLGTASAQRCLAGASG